MRPNRYGIDNVAAAMLVVTLAVVGLAYAYQAAKSLGWV